MLDLDTWQEILDTVRANKLRTFLTGFSVAWGIFMLIVLLGSGDGLGHGVEYQFRDDAMNSIWMRRGQTSIPYKGLQPGRNVQFTNEDYDEIRTGVDGVEHITSRFFIRGNLRFATGTRPAASTCAPSTPTTSTSRRRSSRRAASSTRSTSASTGRSR